MCLPRGKTSETVRPVRSVAASWATRSSPRRSVWPGSAVFIRFAASQTVSPSGTRPSVPPRRGRRRPRSAGRGAGHPGGGKAQVRRGAEPPVQRRDRATNSPVTAPEAVVAAAEPVTVTVARDVRADQREAFEGWAAEVLDLAARFPGNLGTSLLRPGPGSTRYHLVYRFADGDSLARWERSTERRAPPQRGEHPTDPVDYAPLAGPGSFFTALTPPRPG